MDVDEKIDFNNFLCALDDQHGHYANVPMALACSHFACNQCLNDYKSTNSSNCDLIKCELCNKEYKIDFDILKESKRLHRLISSNSNILMQQLAKKFKNQLDNLRKKMDDTSANFYLNINFAKKEVELRCMSLKSQLDEMREKLIKKFDYIKSEYIKKQNEIKYDEYRTKLTLLENTINQNASIDEQMITNTQSMLKKLQQTLQSLDDIPLTFDLSLKDETLDDSIIGNVDYNFKNALKELDNKEFKKIDLDYTPKGLCCITDNRLLVSDLTNKCLKSYDENFKLIKTTPARRSINPHDVIFDGSNRIYFSEDSKDSITALNLNLTFVKKVGGTKGTQNGQFDEPLGLDFSNESLYVCDSNNQRIQKFTKDLVFQKSYPLQFKPWMIKVINNYALIRPNGEPNILSIYSLEPKMKIINKIEGNASISKNELGFYAFSHSFKFMTCLSVGGELTYEKTLVIPKEVDISDGNVFFEYFNNSFVMSCATAKSLVIIK